MPPDQWFVSELLHLSLVALREWGRQQQLHWLPAT
jgi:hypothetical protein